jgi:hypothetical protein
MTVIAGLVHDGRVTMGGDPAGARQLLRYTFTPPTIEPGECLERYMATTFVDAVRFCLKAGGWAKKDSEHETGGQFLVGIRGRLFRIEDDYQVGEALDGYNAVGCGDDVVKGALFATAGRPPAERIRTALEAAERWNNGVRGPFTILSTDD